MSTENNWIVLNPPEKKRTYYFPSQVAAVFENVTKLQLNANGKQALVTADGKTVYVAAGWLWLEVVN